MSKDKTRLFFLSALVLLGLIGYANSLHAPFILDDRANIVENRVLHKLENFIHPSQAERFTGNAEYPMLVKRYVSLLSLALNYRIHGLDTTGYHIVNIAIHILNTLLVYALVLLTFHTPFMKNSRIAPYTRHVALLAAALFVTHPVQTQAVTYIVQRMASLATLFYLASLVCYVRSRLARHRREQAIFYVLALVSAVLGMKSKEITFTLPLAILMYEFFFWTGEPRKRIIRWIPLGLTMLIIPVTQLLLRQGGLEAAMSVAVAKTPRLHYLMTESRVLMTYLRLVMAPFGQNLMYDYPIYTSVLNPHVLLSGLFHLGALAVGVSLYIRSRTTEPGLRLLSFGMFWFYLTLAVESTLVPLHPIYEHRVYLPSVGVFAAVAAGGVLVYERLGSKGLRRAAVLLMVAVPLVLGGLTIARNSVWKTEVSLWKDNEIKAPLSLFPGYNLGNAYKKIGQHRAAIVYYRKALSITPSDGRRYVLNENYAEMYMHIGDSYRILKEPDKALEAYNMALQIDPEGPFAAIAFNSTGAIYLSFGRNAEAVNSFIRAVRLEPDTAYIHSNLGLAYLRLGKNNEAIKAFRNALRLDPSDQKAQNLLNRILAGGSE